MSSEPLDLTPAQLTFDDEFNSFVSSPNGSVGWMTAYPYGGESARALPGNGEAEYYSDSTAGKNPFSIVNGVLDITATVNAPGHMPYGLPYTSGLITTYKSFAQAYGYFEIRAELPAGQGLWPAFWMLPDSVAYAAELDIFEVLENKPTTLYATTHGVVNGAWQGNGHTLTVANTTTGFHTYGVDWEPTTITFYIDGTAVANAPTPAAMTKPMYMLANLAVGAPGSWPGAPNASTVFPATMQIDYIRAYATGNTIKVGGTQAIETAAITGQITLAGAGEPGATVELLNAAGTVISTATSNASGAVTFSGLAAGDYQLHYAPPPGMTLAAGGPASQATGLTARIAVSAGQTVTLGTEQLASPNLWATIAANAYHFGGPTDPSGGAADPGVTVALINATGGVVATAASDANGAFSFGKVAAGTYQLRYTPPPGQAIQPGTAVNATTDLTAPFTVAAGQTFAAPNGDFVSVSALSGTVQLGTAGDAGVTISLLNASATVVAKTTTDSAGHYVFNGVAAGSYQVKYALPAGQVLAINPAVDTWNGLSTTITLTEGQSVVVPTQQALTSPATIQSNVVHFGGATDPSYGGGDGGVAVALVNASGAVIATTTSAAGGWFKFDRVAPGSYQVRYTPPAGQAIRPGGVVNPTTDLTAPFTVSTGQSLWLPDAGMISAFSMNGSGVTASGTNGSYVVTGNASNSTLTLGNGNQSVTLTGTADSVTTGNGNQTIKLAGTHNSVTVGTGVSTINAGRGNAVVHAAGGTTTITATGGGNLFDAGSGIGVFKADGSAGNVFLLNPSGSSALTTITGFSAAAGDVLDLKRTLAGTDILADLSNLATYVTATANGANTTLAVDPTGGGGTPATFGVLVGTHVSVAQLLADHAVSLM